MLASNARSNRDFSYFDKLSTEELREIIRQDSLLDENEDSDRIIQNHFSVDASQSVRYNVHIRR